MSETRRTLAVSAGSIVSLLTMIVFAVIGVLFGALVAIPFGALAGCIAGLAAAAIAAARFFGQPLAF